MATPKLQLFFLVCIFSLLLCFFHCHSSQFELNDEDSWLNEVDDEVVTVQSGQKLPQRRCDFSSGKWVYDQSYPLYDSNCPYLSSAVTCQRNGRPDSDYEKWRWKPQSCSIPRYVRELGSLVNSAHQVYAIYTIITKVYIQVEEKGAWNIDNIWLMRILVDINNVIS